jgi:hypothetical protein
MADLVYYALIVMVMFVSFRVLKANRRQTAAMQAPERTAEAATHGWSYEHDQTPLFEIERWRGTSDGIAWVTEAARSGTRRSGPFGTGAALKGSATLITRWHTEQRMPVSGAVLLLHRASNDKDEISDAIGEITSPLARKIIGKVLDAGLSVRFGSAIGADVEGSALVPSTLPASGYEGYSLLASDPSEASALLFQRLGPALATAQAAAGTLSLSVLITPKGVAVSAPKWPAQTDELVPIVNAGVTLARAMR